MGEARVEGSLVAPVYLPGIIPQVEAYLRAALEERGADFTYEEVVAGCLDGSVQLWVAADVEEETILAAVVTEVLTHSKGKALCVVLAGGREIDSWLHLMDVLDCFGARFGCQEIRCAGRKGWERKLKPLGFKFDSVCVTRPIGERH